VTKRWSSTRSGDGKTKRQASKEARQRYKPEMVKRLRELDKQPPEATFKSGAELMKYLNS
jgi:hypothetical protein